MKGSRASRPGRRLPSQLGRRLVGSDCISYLIPALAGAAVASTWFGTSTMVAGGDIGPFVFSGNLPEFSWSWNHSLTGAGSPSFRISVAAAVALHWFVRFLGGTDGLAQALWYSLLLGGAGLGASYFVGAFTRNRMVIVAAGLVAVVNPVVLTDAVNSMTLLSIGLMGGLGGLVLRSALGVGCRPATFGVISIGAAYLVNNPPSLAVLAAWVVTVAVASGALLEGGSSRIALRFLVRASPWVLVLNAWWLVPLILTLGAQADDLRVAAETQVRSWSWTHARASVENVLTLNTKWGWGDDRYFPAAGALDRPGWSWLRFALPGGAFLAPFVARGGPRRAAALLLGAVVVLAFVAKGLHPPLAGVNLWLYDHVPGFWLLRSPASKLSPAILLLYAALLTILIAGLMERIQHRGLVQRKAAILAGAALVAATLAYPYPLWNGTQFRYGGEVATARQLKLPVAWEEAAQHINTSETRGKVLQLPLLDYYQMRTTWGYYGVDSIATAKIERPVLQRIRGSYFSPSRQFDDLLGAAETAIATADARAVPGLLQALGVSHVLIRRDFDLSEVSRRDLTPPELVATNLGQVRELRRVFSNSVADIFEVESDAETRLQTFDGPVRVGEASTFSTAAVASASGVGAVTSGPGLPVAELGDAEGQRSLDVAGSRRYRLTETLKSPRTFSAELQGRGADRIVEFRPVSDIAVTGLVEQRVATVQVEARPDSAGVQVDDHFHRFENGRALVPIDTLGPVAVMSPDRSVSALGPFSPLGDCLATSEDDGSDPGLATADLVSEVPPAFMLTARGHRACRAAPIEWRKGQPVQFSFEHRSSGPRSAQFCLWETGPDRCAAMPPLPAAEDWTRFEIAHLPAPETTRLSLFLYASGDGGPQRTITQYRAIEAWNLSPTTTTTISPVAPAQQVHVPDGAHSVEFRTLTDELPRLREFGDVGDCLRRESGARTDVSFSARPLSGRGVELRARSATACVAAPVQPFVARAAYRLRFEYRPVAGRTPRVCMYQGADAGCTPLPPVEAGDGWQSFDGTFTADRGAQGLTLFLYADADDGDETVTQYRDLSVTLAAPSVVVAMPVQEKGRHGPTIAWRQRNPAQFDAAVYDASSPFLLVLTESFSKRWVLRGLPPGATADHLRAHGYANGWFIKNARGDLRLTVEYAPAALGRASIAVSLAAAIIALASRPAMAAWRRLAAPNNRRRR